MAATSFRRRRKTAQVYSAKRVHPFAPITGEISMDGSSFSTSTQLDNWKNDCTKYFGRLQTVEVPDVRKTEGSSLKPKPPCPTTMDNLIRLKELTRQYDKE